MMDKKVQLSAKKKMMYKQVSELTDWEIDEEYAKDDVPIPIKKHWLWSSWIALAICAAVSFTIANVFIGKISALGIKSVNYFNTGSLIFSIFFFIYKREWARRNRGPPPGLLDKDRRKVLTRKWNSNEFDWWSVFICLVGAMFQVAIYVSIAYTFKLANMAGLNIGISQAIWAINPFQITFLEWLFYKQKFNFNQIWGMLALVLCAVIVSLSEVLLPQEEEEVVVSTSQGGAMVFPNEKPTEKKLPIYAAILFSLIMPSVCTLFVVVVKYVDNTLKLRSTDFTIAYWGFMSLAFQIAGLVSY